MGQLLVTALGVMLLMTAGASFALAMGAVGVMTWAMAHGHGLASFINNPAAAKASYLRNLTLGQALTDGLDLAMTFIPLGAAGAGSVARTTARTMATNRTLMKEGTKEATQATKHTAARTQAQHVTESQAAHTHEPHESRNNFQRQKEINVKLFRPTATTTHSVAGRKIVLQDSWTLMSRRCFKSPTRWDIQELHTM